MILGPNYSLTLYVNVCWSLRWQQQPWRLQDDLLLQGSRTNIGKQRHRGTVLTCLCSSRQKNLHLHNSEGHRKYLKLMEKIPEDAEATVVLVGKRQHVDSPDTKRPVQGPAVGALSPDLYVNI